MARGAPTCPPTVLSEMRQHGFGARYLQPRTRLDEHLLDLAVVDDQRKALRALAHAEAARVELETERPRELAVPVRHHPNLAVRLLTVPPRAHDERVVDGHAHDLVHALAFDLRRTLDEAWQVLHRAGRRKRPRHREHDDLLPFEEITDRNVLRPLLAHFLQLDVRRQLVADFDGHALPPFS